MLEERPNETLAESSAGKCIGAAGATKVRRRTPNRERGGRRAGRGYTIAMTTGTPRFPTVSVMLVTAAVAGAGLLAAAQGRGSNVTVAAGKSVTVDGTNLTVRFERVLNDSRCPTDVQCITAGDAVVLVAVEGGGARETGRYELHTANSNREAAHGEYRLGVVDLKPVPTSRRPVPAGEYVLTLRVSRP